MKTHNLLGLLVVFTSCIVAVNLKSTAASNLFSNNEHVIGVLSGSRSEYPGSVQTPTPVNIQTPIPGSTPRVRIPIPRGPGRIPVWTLRPDPTPSIPPNSDIILFIHGMDSRAEEADDITKALFGLLGSRSSRPAPAPQQPNAAIVAVLNQLLQKYRSCILERYETQQDMVNRGLAANLSGLTTTAGLQDRDAGVVCVSGNLCSLAARRASFTALQAQANRGDPTNFESNLEMAIPRDCFECQKH